MYSIAEHSSSDVKADEQTAPETVDGRTTRWTEHRERRRLELVKAARRAIHDGGPDLSMEELATRVGTSKSILYRYFNDRASLRGALADHVLGRARAQLQEASQSSRDPKRAVAAMVATYLAAVQSSYNVFLFINRPGHNCPEERKLIAFVQQVEELVADTIAPLVAPETSKSRLALWSAAIVGLVREAAEEWVATPKHERVSHSDLEADLTTMVWDGTHGLLAAHRGSPPTSKEKS